MNIFAELEKFKESETVTLKIIRIESVFKGVFPSIFIQGTVFYRSDSILPLISCSQVHTFYDAAAGEAEYAGMLVSQCLCNVAAKSVFVVIESIDREQTDVFQVHTVFPIEEDAQLSFFLRTGRFDDYLIFLPFIGSDVQFLRGELLPFLHRVRFDELHSNLCRAIAGTCPDCKSVIFVFEYANAEVTFVHQSRAALMMTWPV